MNTDLNTDAPRYDYPGDYYGHETVEARAEAVYGAIADARGVEKAASYLLDIGQPIVITNGTAGAYDREKMPATIPWPEHRATGDGKFNTHKNPVTEFDDLLDGDRLILKKGNGIAIAPTLATGLVVLDADKPEEVDALAAWYTEATGEALPEPTVKTPGKQDDDGNWKHSEGGHWYLQLPPADPEAYKAKTTIEHGESQFDLMAGKSYAIAPPSRRTEGAYELNGEILLADKGTPLYEAVMEALDPAVKAPRTPSKGPGGAHGDNPDPSASETIQAAIRGYYNASGAAGGSAERVEIWEANTSWLTILAGTPVSPTGKAECGGTCIEVHREGAATQRSGVAHEDSCRTGELAGRLIFFSGTAEGEDGTKAMGKFTAFTKYKAGGVYLTALAMEGLRDEDQPDYDPAARRASKARGVTKKESTGADPVASIEDQVIDYALTAFDTYQDSKGGFLYVKKGRVTAVGRQSFLNDIQSNGRADGKMATKDNIQKAEARVNHEAEDSGEGATLTTDPRTLADPVDPSITYTYIGGEEPVMKLSPGLMEFQKDLPRGLAFNTGPGRRMDIDPTARIEDLDELWELINVPEEARLLITGWLIQRWITTTGGIPILFFKGEGGLGKTETANYLKELTDPYGTRLDISLPNSPEEARTAFSHNGALAIDNIGSFIKEEQSNILCRASTGGAEVGRELYTSNGMRVTSYRLGLILTAIDAPSMAADLQSRTLLIEPAPLEEKAYKMAPGALSKAKREKAALIRGALAQLAAEVMATIPKLPPLAPGELRDRLDDYQNTIRAIHKITGMGDPLTLQRTKAVLSHSALPEVIQLLMEYQRPYHGTSGEIARDLSAERGPVSPGMPTITHQKVGGALKAKGMKDILESAYTVSEKPNPGRGSIWTLTPLTPEASLTTTLA